MALKVNGYGPKNAEIILVGEAPGFDEEIAGTPFVGASGKTLDTMLREAGIRRDDCYITNVCKFRPPGNEMDKWLHTKKQIGKKEGYALHNGRWAHPLVTEGLQELQEEMLGLNNKRVIVGFGNTTLWALAGEWGVSNWRGSEMHTAMGTPFVPTLHPASVIRNWASRPYVIHDLKQRVVKRLSNGFIIPEFHFNTAPTFDEVITCLKELANRASDVVGDVETAGGHIICLGLAWSDRDALCIPFRGSDGVYWSKDEQLEILAALEAMSKRVKWIGQNWNYDAQYFAEDFRMHVMADFDCYIAQSVLFPGVERSLGFLSSMYCEWHCFWKEDAKDWGKIADFDGLFRYCCRDCVSTWEIKQVQSVMLTKAGLMPQFIERMKYSYHVYTMMRNGVIRNDMRTEKMKEEIGEAIQTRQLAIAEVAGHAVSYASPAQVAKLLYTELGCKTMVKRGTTSVTTNDEALKVLTEKYPERAPLILSILECRSLASLRSNYLNAEVDPDGKFRSSWMATGTETFRLTSSGNAFHRGGPLQNLTDGIHTHSGRPLPNLRSTIVPPPGCTIFNCDLERADLQVVVWEADDTELKQMLLEHVDIHTENAMAILRKREITQQERHHFGKTFVHLTNYGGGSRTCAVKIGCTVHEADLAQRRWFEAHPGIKKWHQRTAAMLLGTRTITNKFGYRRVYFDRLEGILPKGLAWVPQSTVAILISLMQMAFNDKLGHLIEITMQGHDSIVGHYRTENEGIVLSMMLAASHIAVPYADPLYIPLGLSTSRSSWGEVEERKWPALNP